MITAERKKYKFLFDIDMVFRPQQIISWKFSYCFSSKKVFCYRRSNKIC